MAPPPGRRIRAEEARCAPEELIRLRWIQTYLNPQVKRTGSQELVEGHVYDALK
jgi:hypothetical protein